ncbi:MAG: nuclear transport factor 2 family protein [Cytophagales bacterium]
METKDLVEEWFSKWESGEIDELPINADFIHESPFGQIIGRDNYLDLVGKNLDKFLGYQFTLHDALYEKNRACVRYTALQGEMSLDVSEWYYIENQLIKKIIAYYHIGEIREERKLSNT